jgi:RNA polymerase sigma-70 factor (ECF subfamily)
MPAFDPARSSLADAGATPSELAVRNEEARLLQRALARLPVDQQIVLEMFYWEGLRGADIATVLGVSPHTVRSRISRAQQAIRAEIGRLADSPALSASTIDGFETWARRVGEAVGTRSASE